MAIEQYKGFKQQLIESQIQKLIDGELELLILISQEDLAKSLYITLETVYDIAYREGTISESYHKQSDMGC